MHKHYIINETSIQRSLAGNEKNHRIIEELVK